MSFIQIIEYETDRPDEMMALGNENMQAQSGPPAYTRLAVTQDRDNPNRYLTIVEFPSYEAAMAISYGLPPEEGLKAVTLYPAQILGVEKELGSIETGKRANLVLTNGDILQASTQVLSLFIDGKPLPPTSKQTRLYERYLERLEEVKSGRAPLGTK